MSSGRVGADRRNGRVVMLVTVGLAVIAILAGSTYFAVWLRGRLTPRPATATIPADGPITIALTGDTSIAFRATAAGARSTSLVNFVRHATLAFTNLEIPPRIESAGGSAPGEIDDASTLRGLGFDLVSLANNHTMDGGVDGLRGRLHALQEAGILGAGAGDDLAAAREPVVVGERNQGLALIAVTASASLEAMATASAADTRGRAGVNPLRYAADVTADEATFRRLAESVASLNSGPPPGDRELVMFGTRIRRGDRTAVNFIVDEADRARILESVRAARRRAAIVVVSIHSHEPSNASDAPAEFIQQFARDAIDAGAQLIVGHGPHRIRHVERYRDGVIFYSLGHFAYPAAGAQAIEADPFDAGQNLYSTVVGLKGETPTTAEQLHGARWWEGLLVLATFDGAELREATIRAIDLSGSAGDPSLGIPRLAEGAAGDAILRRLADISRSAGTLLEVSDGSVLHVPISKSR